jgi:hypothetical protein
LHEKGVPKTFKNFALGKWIFPRVFDIVFGVLKIMIVERNAAGPDRGIEAAIKHFHNGDLDIAITLAAAGEGQPPETTKEYLFRMLRRAERWL